MSVRCVFLGAPENLGFLGRAEALVARRFNRGPQRASLEWGEEEMRSAASLCPGKRLSLAKPSPTNATAKLLLFSDMAMGCPGLRALLVRIACNQALGYRGYLGYPTCVYFLKLCYI